MDHCTNNHEFGTAWGPKKKFPEFFVGSKSGDTSSCIYAQAEELVRDWHTTWSSLLQSRILLTDSHPLQSSNDISALLDTR